jgi:beta-phosphoglucomutase-like phosphatase (HAD superfamily)
VPAEGLEPPANDVAVAYYVDAYETSLLHELEQALTPQRVMPALIDACVAGRHCQSRSHPRPERSWIATTLRSLGIADFFPVVVTGDDTVHGKSDPAM